MSVISEPSGELKSPGKEFNSNSRANVEQVSVDFQIWSPKSGVPQAEEHSVGMRNPGKKHSQPAFSTIHNLL